MLEMTGSKCVQIYYTLDGSEPSADSLLYTGPILIQDATLEENRWSIRTDVSNAYVTGEETYPIPDHQIDKCTIVRAVCVDQTGQSSDIESASYFIGYQEKKGYRNLRVVSIITDPDNLFDPETGIYVLGNTFLKEYHPEHAEGDLVDIPANYLGKGMVWEREAEVQIFDFDRSLLLRKKLGLRIKGYGTACGLPKSLNLYARDEYDGEPVISADLFGTGYQAKAISISMGGNGDSNLKVREWLTTRLAGNLGVDMSRYEPCCVFLDGEYWGAGWLTEKIDKTFLQYYHGADPETISIVKETSHAKRYDVVEKPFWKTWASISDSDLRDPKEYERVGSLFDLENTMRYFALEIYIGNRDWGPINNIMTWRADTTGQEEEGDGKWRWALFDVNSWTVYLNSHGDYVTSAKEDFSIFRSLMENETYNRQFYETLKMFAEEVFTPKRTAQALSEYRDLMGEALQADHIRFYNRNVDFSELDDIQRFFEERAEYIRIECEKHLSK